MKIIFLSMLILLSSCSSLSPGTAANENYVPASLGPQMDMNALRADGFNRSF